MLDTGFDGHLILPAGFLPTASPPNGETRWTLADGSEVRTPWYAGTLTIGDSPAVSVVVSLLGNEPIVGLAVIRRFKVTLDHGERVVVEP